MLVCIIETTFGHFNAELKEKVGTDLSNTNSIHPLMQCSDIITAQILDVLGLLLDLWMLPNNIKHI